VKRSALNRLVLISSVLVIFALTLFPAPEIIDPARGTREWRFSLSDLLANVVLFVPFGVGLALLGRGLRHTLLVAAALSVGIELAQLLIPGRYPGASDTAANAAGAALGYLVVRQSGSWLVPEPTLARRLMVGAGLLVAFALGASGWLLEPSLTEGQYYVHAPPDVIGLDRYTGEIRDIELDGRPLGKNEISGSERVRDALRGDFELSFVAAGGSFPGPRTGLLMITDASSNMLFLAMISDGRDVVVGYRGRAAALRLEASMLRVEGALDGLRGTDPIRLHVSREDGRICVALNGTQSCGLEPGVRDGWSTFIPQLAGLAGRSRALGILWMALLAVPLGYWFRPTWYALLVLAGVALVAVTIPLWTPMLPLLYVDVAAAVAGLLAGMGIARFISRR
jgi:VanZ family protein